MCVNRDRREIDELGIKPGQRALGGGGCQLQCTDGGAANDVAAIDGAVEHRARRHRHTVGMSGGEPHRESARRFDGAGIEHGAGAAVDQHAISDAADGSHAEVRA